MGHVVSDKEKNHGLERSKHGPFSLNPILANFQKQKEYVCVVNVMLEVLM